MIVYTYSTARQKLAELLEQARTQEVIIKRNDGSWFSLKEKKMELSPFNIEGIESDATTEDIISAIRESRSVNQG